jgi:GNAT superfamily N-acetyltransferase
MNRPPVVDVSIGLAQPEDFESAGKATAEAFREFARVDDPSWDEYIGRVEDVASRAPHMPVLVARDRSGIVGSVTIEIDDRRVGDDPPFPSNAANLRMLGVRPGAQRRGIGKALVEAVCQFALERRKDAVVLHIVETRVAGRALYASMGFERDPDRDFADPSSGLTLVAYRLALGDSPRGERLDE